MTTTPKSTSARRGQQTLYESAASKLIQQFPRGIFLRYEAGNDELEQFILRNPLITYVVVNFSDAWNLVEEHGSLHNFLSRSQVPIVTATEDDQILANRRREDIASLLKRIEPAIYIPDAGKVYGSDDECKQRGGLREYKIRVDWLVEQIAEQGWEIRLLPLAKTIDKWHVKEMLPCYRKHGFDEFAVYARQYYSDGNRFADFQQSMNNLVAIAEPKRILVVGLLGKSHLERLPMEVQGACGIKQFFSNCDYRNDQFEPWRADLNNNYLNQPTLVG